MPPIFSNLGVASSSGFGFASTAVSGGNFFLGYFTYSGTQNFQYFTSMGVDSAGNIFSSGSPNGADGIFIFKVDSFGNFVLAKYINNGISSRGCVVGPSGNIYIGAFFSTTATSGYIVKLNNNASGILYQKSLTGNVGIGQVFIDKTETYVYTIGWRFDTPNRKIIWNKYNASDLTIVDGGISSTNVTNQGKGGSVDSSGNIYLAGYTATGSSASYDGFLLKVASDMHTNVWKRKVANGTSSAEYRDTCVDSSANVYSCGAVTVSTQGRGYISKYNTSGTIQWQKQYAPGSLNDLTYFNITIDPSEQYIYCVGQNTTSSSGIVIITKLDISGTLIYHRSLSIGSSSYIEPGSIYVDANAMYISGNMQITGATGQKPFIFKLPLDGSRTGTYTVGSTTITYSTISYTETSTVYSGTSTLVYSGASTPTLTNGTSSFSDLSSTYTSSVI